MATEQNITVNKSRTKSIVVTVTGISDWTDMLAKMVLRLRREDETNDLTLTGSIDEANDKVTFTLTYAQADALTSGARYSYEVVIYKADQSFVDNCNYGSVTVEGVLLADPTA